MSRTAISVVISAVLFLASCMHARSANAAEPGNQPGDAQRGWDLLRTKPYLPADFDDQTFDGLWKSWPKDLRAEAKTASVDQRRRLAFERYGLVQETDAARIGDNKLANAIGYLKSDAGTWVMTCFACHAGRIEGKTIPGLPNTVTALQTLTEEIRITKIRLGKKLTHLDVASLTIPLNTTNGTTNSVMFGVALGNYRDKDMNVIAPKTMERLVHHDMDAPPWWNIKKKKQLYIDGFSPKNHRVLMQFMLLPLNDGATVRQWEEDFRHVLAYIESLEAPKYQGPIDHALAKQGRTIFNQNCAKCHGTYGETETYPEVTVPIDEIGTDPVRLSALSSTHRRWMQVGWMSRYGKDRVVVEPKGYVAPPLDGIWATAPYFHNGSVPTLWHVLNPEERPAVWKRTSLDGLDREHVGLEVKTFRSVPEDAKLPAERRWYFDASRFGKSNRGHDYPNALNVEEKRAVLEYLKSL